MGTQQQLKISDMQVENLSRTVMHTKIVQKDLATIPAQTRMYEGVGRMFVLQPTDTVKENLDKKIAAAEDKIITIQKKKTYLERDIKDSESSLRELVLSKKQARS